MRKFFLSQLFKREIKTIWILAIPTIAIQISRTLMTFVDFTIVSKLGTEAQAAITPAFLTIMIIFSLGMGCVGIVSTFASQSQGHHQPEEASIYLWQALYFSILFSLITLIFIPYLRPILSLYGHEEIVLQYEIDYTRISIYSVFPTVAAFALQSFFIGILQPKISFYSTLIANIANGLLCYALVFGYWGFPEMSFSGSAWATFWATVIQFCILFFVFLQKKIHSIFKSRTLFQFHFQNMKNLIRIGIPNGLSWVNDMLAWNLFMAFIIGHFGTAELAASNIAFQFMRLSFMPVYGLAQTLSSLIGNAIGKGKLKLVYIHAYVGTAQCVAWAIFCGIIFVVFGQELMAIYSDDPEIIAVGKIILLYVALFEIFDAIALSFLNILAGAGDTFWPTVFSSLINWVFFIPFSLLLTYQFPQYGSLGPWMICTLMLLLLGTAMFLRFKSGKWKKIDIFSKK